jgi:hypothetical protein
MASTRLLALLPVLFVAACPNNAITPTDGAVDGQMTPSKICDAYLACLAEVEPQSFPSTLQIYQAGGPCWKTTTAAAGCEKACADAQAALLLKHPSSVVCGAKPPNPDLGRKRDQAQPPNPPPTNDVDILFMIDNSNSMEQMQKNLRDNFPNLIGALRSPKTNKLPNLRIGVISPDLGAGSFSFETCETPGGDGGRLHNTPGKLSLPGCPTPSDKWISYTESGGVVTTNVQGATSTDPEEQVKQAFSCIAYLGPGGCGFEQPLEATRLALSGANPGFLRTGSILVVVLITNEDDCSARKPDLFDPSQQGLNDPLGPLASFRCTEFGLVCAEKLRQVGSKTNCVPGLDYLHYVSDYVSFFQGLRPQGNLLVAAIAAPPAPVEVGLDGQNPTLKHSCSSVAGSGDPAIRIKAVTDGLGPYNGLFNAGVTGAVDICSTDYSPALQKIGQHISAWYP